MNEENYKIAALLAKNNADEEEAIQGYYELLEVMIDKNDKDIIREIVSDEKNHAHLLTEMMLKYDANIVEAED
ncbi:MAG: hypothetical protein LBQ02_02415 [Candidatus Nomurabacteria bacterium]|jgi:rubrerythrin|nr:hypothetical protein [Candidatus Nomurabacteria bacterium]